ncbi:MAG: hypothetical protein IPL61_30765 [Myxococcales bacterium]|nr:hypothetical protein [Myxococcales bacterium]
MTEPTVALATWWSLAEANSTVLTIVVAIVAAAALAFVGHRLWTRRR